MFKNIFFVASSLIVALSLSACNKEMPVGKPMKVTGDTVATVNGIAITQTDLNSMTSARQMGGHGAPADENLDDAIGMELIRQKAVAEKLHEDPEVAAEINRQATSVLVSAYVRNMVETQPVSDEDLRKEYDTRVGSSAGKEYKSRHILSKTQDEAEANIAELKKGKDFAKLAEEKSTGPSGPEGGDLGWASPNNYVPEFSAAMTALEPGKYSETPVQTQFGWHVILLEEVRDSQLPDFESVKPQLQRMVVNQRIGDFVQQLKDEAKIDIKTATAAAKTEGDAEEDTGHEDHAH
jgi:peptidyl-prolyl cis-trans isomerase C